MHILFGGSDFDSRYMYTSLKKKKKKRFPTDRPNLKILSPKGQHNNFFYLALLSLLVPTGMGATYLFHVLFACPQ